MQATLTYLRLSQIQPLPFTSTPNHPDQVTITSHLDCILVFLSLCPEPPNYAQGIAERNCFTVLLKHSPRWLRIATVMQEDLSSSLDSSAKLAFSYINCILSTSTATPLYFNYSLYYDRLCAITQKINIDLTHKFWING